MRHMLLAAAIVCVPGSSFADTPPTWTVGAGIRVSTEPRQADSNDNGSQAPALALSAAAMVPVSSSVAVGVHLGAAYGQLTKEFAGTISAHQDDFTVIPIDLGVVVRDEFTRAWFEGWAGYHSSFVTKEHTLCQRSICQPPMVEHSFDSGASAGIALGLKARAWSGNRLDFVLDIEAATDRYVAVGIGVIYGR